MSQCAVIFLTCVALHRRDLAAGCGKTGGRGGASLVLIKWVNVSSGRYLPSRSTFFAMEPISSFHCRVVIETRCRQII
ncbi:hypothetical protein CEXT_702221 [Caerostris extrusa]|uniref:Secreted protein n=1 Tax=Caerostris extrusa TaxID=172846 RepID=A0AAV4XSI8_CAEEX|nr:hypothetical protein CEXT_702221 [Caerostris extrusa]